MKRPTTTAGSSASTPAPSSRSGIARDEWLKALESAGSQFSDDDQCAVTVPEFAAMYTPPLNKTTATRTLQHLVSVGKAKRTRKRSSATADGRVMMMVAYRLL